MQIDKARYIISIYSKPLKQTNKQSNKLTLANVSVPCLHTPQRTLSFPGFTAWQKFLQKT